MAIYGGKSLKKVKSRKNTGSKAQVYHGNVEKTRGGLVRKTLKKVKGRIVSLKKHNLGINNTWAKCVKEARNKLKIKGFVLINSGPKGKELYKKAKELYKKKKN